MRRNAPISPFVLIKGAGEMASAVAWRLHRANIKRLCMLDLDRPLAVRRRVAFCPALELGFAEVEGVSARAAQDWPEIESAWAADEIPVIRATDWASMGELEPDVVIDSILAKRNTGTTIDQAPLVIALGPGFEAGRDCHLVIETDRGHDLGRIIEAGPSAPNTGIPGDIAGQTETRVLRAPRDGMFVSDHDIGDRVNQGDVVGTVGGHPVVARTGGVLRGLLASGTDVPAGLKLGDIDPRGRVEYCATISDKARAIAGSALECVLRVCNTCRP